MMGTSWRALQLQADNKFFSYSGGYQPGGNTWLQARLLETCEHVSIGYRIGYQHPGFEAVFTKVGDDLFSIESRVKCQLLEKQ